MIRKLEGFIIGFIVAFCLTFIWMSLGNLTDLKVQTADIAGLYTAQFVISVVSVVFSEIPRKGEAMKIVADMVIASIVAIGLPILRNIGIWNINVSSIELILKSIWAPVAISGVVVIISTIFSKKH